MTEAHERSGSWQDAVYETQINIWPEADTACEGFGDYYATAFCAVQSDQITFITLHIGNYLPRTPEGSVDYDGIVDMADRYLTNYYGGGKTRLFANAVSIRKDCYDYDHDDGVTTDRQSRDRLERREHVASIVVASELSPFETIEESDPLRMLGKVGLWMPRARKLEVVQSLKVAKSLRGGDTSVAFIALQGDEKIVERTIYLPDGIFDPEAIQRVIELPHDQLGEV